MQTPEQQSWLPYDFTIEYKSGKENIPIDALSRSFFMTWSATDSRPVIQPVSILQTRTIIRGNQQVKQHLILWEGLDSSNATWED